MPRKPFVLFAMKKQPKSKLVKKRMKAPMREQARECEWFLGPSKTTPECALGLAVLQRAILDLITPGVSEKDRDNAADWINGAWGDRHEREYPLSFSRIVESFTEIDTVEFRSKILEFASRAKFEDVLADNFRFQRG